MSHRGRPRSRLFPGNRRSIHAVDFEAMRHEMADLELKMEEEDIFQTEEQAAAAAVATEQGAEADEPSLEVRAGHLAQLQSATVPGCAIVGPSHRDVPSCYAANSRIHDVSVEGFSVIKADICL